MCSLKPPRHISTPPNCETSTLFQGWSGLRRRADAAVVRVKVSSGPAAEVNVASMNHAAN